MYAFRFCPDCGAELAPPDTARLLAQTCQSCGAIHWRNAKPCAGALVVRDGRVLLGRRAVEPAKGAWDIPGGFLEPWEAPAHAAIREVREETGLEIGRLYVVRVQPFYLRKRRAVEMAIVFAAFVNDTSIATGIEHQNHAWLSVDEALERFAFPGERASLREIAELLSTGDAGSVDDVMRVL